MPKNIPHRQAVPAQDGCEGQKIFLCQVPETQPEGREDSAPTRAIGFARAIREVSCERGFSHGSPQSAVIGPPAGRAGAAGVR